MTYWIEITLERECIEKIGPVILDNGDKWKNKACFVPKKGGVGQKVEFLLF